MAGLALSHLTPVMRRLSRRVAGVAVFRLDTRPDQGQRAYYMPSQNDHKTEVFVLRLAPAERDRLDALAEDAGVSAAEIVRGLILAASGERRAPAASPLFRKREAAEYMRRSLRWFERNAMKELIDQGLAHRMGGSFMFKKEDLDAWLAQKRVVVAQRPERARSTPRASKQRASASPLVTGRAAEILERLRKPRRAEVP